MIEIIDSRHRSAMPCICGKNGKYRCEDSKTRCEECYQKYISTEASNKKKIEREMFDILKNKAIENLKRDKFLATVVIFIFDSKERHEINVYPVDMSSIPSKERGIYALRNLCNRDIPDRYIIITEMWIAHITLGEQEINPLLRPSCRPDKKEGIMMTEYYKDDTRVKSIKIEFTRKDDEIVMGNEQAYEGTIENTADLWDFYREPEGYEERAKKLYTMVTKDFLGQE